MAESAFSGNLPVPPGPPDARQELTATFQICPNSDWEPAWNNQFKRWVSFSTFKRVFPAVA